MKINTAGKIVITLGLCAFSAFAQNALAATINVTAAASPGCATGQCPDFTISGDCTLQDALDVAQCNLEDDIINIAPGLYDSDAAGTFSYNASDGENFDLSIIGADASTVTIDGGDDDQCLDIDTRFAGGDDLVAISLSEITCQNGFFGGPGGGVAINVVSATVSVQNNIFQENVAQEWGGGLYVLGTGNGALLFNSNLFLLNSNTNDPGAGMYAESGGGDITATNNIFAQNTAEDSDGGGMYLNASDGDITITNNTLFNNTSTLGNGGGIGAQVDSGNTFQIYNNIVFGNTAGTNGDDIWTCEQGGTVNLFNNDFTEYYSEGSNGGCGSAPTINQGSNIPDDPQFVDSTANDFHLLATSPAVDTGDLNPPNGLPTPDFDGVTRPQGPLPDMGALEFQAIPTPSPTPSPTPVPPIVNNLFLSGDGILSCSMQANAGAYTGSIAASVMLLAGGLATLWMVRRRSR